MECMAEEVRALPVIVVVNDFSALELPVVV